MFLADETEGSAKRMTTKAFRYSARIPGCCCRSQTSWSQKTLYNLAKTIGCTSCPYKAQLEPHNHDRTAGQLCTYNYTEDLRARWRVAVTFNNCATPRPNTPKPARGMPGLPSLHRQLGWSPQLDFAKQLQKQMHAPLRTRECVQRGHRRGCRKGKPPDICGLVPVQAI